MKKGETLPASLKIRTNWCGVKADRPKAIKIAPEGEKARLQNPSTLAYPLGRDRLVAATRASPG
jgi:hypothetical protein